MCTYPYIQLTIEGRGRSAKFIPCRDGPYLIPSKWSPSTFEIDSLDDPQVPIGVYHESAFKAYTQSHGPPVNSLHTHGHPKNLATDSLLECQQNQRERL